MDKVILKSFEQPDEIREFEKGKFETVQVGELVIGRATYQPGWLLGFATGDRCGTSHN